MIIARSHFGFCDKAVKDRRLHKGIAGEYMKMKLSYKTIIYLLLVMKEKGETTKVCLTHDSSAKTYLRKY